MYLDTLLLTFINTTSSPYLQALDKERKELEEVLRPIANAGVIQLVTQNNATLDSISTALAEYKEKLVLFHFAGHSNSLGLESEEGILFMEGLATQLASHPNIKLVFLNGCATQQQVYHFFKQGIPIVLATTRDILDGEASLFASRFYKALARRNTIQQAFQNALGAIKMRNPEYDHYPTKAEEWITRRGLEINNLPQDRLPWQLFVAKDADEVLNWKLNYPRFLTTIPKLNVDYDFIGRKALLANLHEKLVVNQKGLQINGVGGMGKTTLVKAYCEFHQTVYNCTAWINCGEDLLTSLVRNSGIEKKLELAFSELEDLESRLRGITGVMSEINGPNLLIIDNAHSELHKNDTFIQLSNLPNWKLLVTSRAHVYGFEAIEVPPLNPENALELFRKFYSEGSDDEILELIKDIGYHTLSIELFAKTLEKQHKLLTIAKLREKLKSQQLNDPTLNETVITNHSTKEKQIYSHLMGLFSFTQLTELQSLICKHFAVLPAIPMDSGLLASFIAMEAHILNAALNELATLGWLKGFKGVFSMHPVVQEVVKYTYHPTEQEYLTMIEVLTNKMKKNHRGNPVLENFTWIQYAEPLYTYLAKDVSAHLSPALGLLTRNLASLYEDQGQQQKAKMLITRALISDKLHFASDPRRVPDTLTVAAEIDYDLGQQERALEMYQEAFEIQTKYLGRNHPDTVRSILCLGVLYLGQQKYDLAWEYLSEVHRWDQGNLEPDDPERAITLFNLASCYVEVGVEFEKKAQIKKGKARNHKKKSIGLMKKAVLYFREALEIQALNYSSDHPRVLETKAGLAVTCYYLEDLVQLDALTEEVIHIEDHGSWFIRKSIVNCLSTQAERYWREKNYTRAKSFFESAIKCIEESLEKPPIYEDIKRRYHLLLQEQDKVVEKKWSFQSWLPWKWKN